MAVHSQEEPLELGFEVGGEDGLADGGADLVEGPEAAPVEFIGRRGDRPVVDGAVDIDQLPLATTVEDILPHPLRLEVGDAEFFVHLTQQGLFRRLTIVDMPAHTGIPLARLDILPLRTALQIDLATGIEHMEMDHRMEQTGTVMTLATGGRAHHRAILIDYRKTFLAIVFHTLLILFDRAKIGSFCESAKHSAEVCLEITGKLTIFAADF